MPGSISDSYEGPAGSEWDKARKSMEEFVAGTQRAPVREQELRDLDARVHREVFGKNPYQDPATGEWVQALVPRLGWALQVPKYSTDIAAAWLVVEKVAEWATDDFDLMRSGGDWVASFRLENKGREPYDDAEGRSPGSVSAPLAICLAALNVVAVSRRVRRN